MNKAKIASQRGCESCQHFPLFRFARRDVAFISLSSQQTEKLSLTLSRFSNSPNHFSNPLTVFLACVPCMTSNGFISYSRLQVLPWTSQIERRQDCNVKIPSCLFTCRFPDSRILWCDTFLERPAGRSLHACLNWQEH